MYLLLLCNLIVSSLTLKEDEDAVATAPNRNHARPRTGASARTSDRLYIIRLSSLQGFIQHLQKEGRRAYII